MAEHHCGCQHGLSREQWTRLRLAAAEYAPDGWRCANTRVGCHVTEEEHGSAVRWTISSRYTTGRRATRYVHAKGSTLDAAYRAALRRFEKTWLGWALDTGDADA